MSVLLQISTCINFKSKFLMCKFLMYMFPLAYYLKYYWSGASSPCSGLEGPSPLRGEGPSTARSKDTW